MSIYTNKNILVTGGTGMIGHRLCERLIEEGAKVAQIGHPSESDDRFVPGSYYSKVDLCDCDDWRALTSGIDMVFHVAGIKGSVALGTSKAASWLVPLLQMDANVMQAAHRAGVERFLYTSSSAVYNRFSFANGPVVEEAASYGDYRVPHERYAGWAKLTGELQAQAYREEHGWDKIAIVRLANVYGPWDGFDTVTAMAIPALIARAVGGENPLKVWGSPDTMRDYLYVDDCVEGMLLAMEHADGEPINLGSGRGMSMKGIVYEIAIATSASLEPGPRLIDFTGEQGGLLSKVLNVDRARQRLGWQAKTSTAEGIPETVRWYTANREIAVKRYDALAATIKAMREML